MPDELFLRAPGAEPGEIEQFLSQSNQLGVIRVTLEEQTKLPPFERTYHQLGWELDGKRDIRSIADSISLFVLGEYGIHSSTCYKGARITIKPKK